MLAELVTISLEGTAGPGVFVASLETPGATDEDECIASGRVVAIVRRHEISELFVDFSEAFVAEIADEHCDSRMAVVELEESLRTIIYSLPLTVGSLYSKTVPTTYRASGTTHCLIFDAGTDALTVPPIEDGPAFGTGPPSTRPSFSVTAGASNDIWMASG